MLPQAPLVFLKMPVLFAQLRGLGPGTGSQLWRNSSSLTRIEPKPPPGAQSISHGAAQGKPCICLYLFHFHHGKLLASDSDRGDFVVCQVSQGKGEQFLTICVSGRLHKHEGNRDSVTDWRWPVQRKNTHMITNWWWGWSLEGTTKAAASHSVTVETVGSPAHHCLLLRSPSRLWEAKARRVSWGTRHQLQCCSGEDGSFYG